MSKPKFECKHVTDHEVKVTLNDKPMLTLIREPHNGLSNEALDMAMDALEGKPFPGADSIRKLGVPDDFTVSVSFTSARAADAFYKFARAFV